MAKNSQVVRVKLTEFYSESYKKRLCCYCEKELDGKGSPGQPKVACSPECFAKARSIAEKSIRVFDCRVCGIAIPPTRDIRTQHCSESCSSEGSWRRQLYRNHHIRIDSFKKIVEEQKGRCAICHLDFEDDRSRMNVDHDHRCCSGRSSCGNCIRGILCNGCNGGIGFFKDDPENLLSAAQYLSHFKERNTNG